MTKRTVLALFATALAFSASAGAPGDAGKTLQHATGSFDVKTQPIVADKSAAISNLSLEKEYHGDLEAKGKGAMLATGSAKGNGAYVALEVVTGKLKGREGSFVLQHTGIATQGTPPQLNITVVPNSGTGQLRTLAGKLTIVVADGKHSYDLEYTLADGS
jgi:Protein of unknown function (DUF3224)